MRDCGRENGRLRGGERRGLAILIRVIKACLAGEWARESSPQLRYRGVLETHCGVHGVLYVEARLSVAAK